ncbi:MAG: hypothetical protein PUG48_07775 [Clostridia bacterium]|nr:hypothetical protein [Clostridia bacterium]
MKIKTKLISGVSALALIAAIGAGSVFAASSPRYVANNSTQTISFGGSTTVSSYYIPEAKASSYRSGAGQTETFRTEIKANGSLQKIYAKATIVTTSGAKYEQYRTNNGNFRTHVYATASIPFNWFWTEGSSSTTGFVNNYNYGSKINFRVR